MNLVPYSKASTTVCLKEDCPAGKVAHCLDARQKDARLDEGSPRRAATTTASGECEVGDVRGTLQWIGWKSVSY